MAATSSSSVVDAEKQAMRIEGEYLQMTVTVSATDNSEHTGADLHKCTPNCIMQNLRPQQRFIFKQKEYMATGYVFICQRTTKLHMCSEVYCEYAQLCREGLVCTLTGLFLAHEVSLARTRFDADVRMVGGYTYTASKYQAAPDNTVDESNEVAVEGEFATALQRRLDYEQACVMTTSNMDTLYRLANNNVGDVNHVLDLHGGKTFDELRRKVIERKDWREYASRAWEKQTMNPDYIASLTHDALAAHDQWYTLCWAYALRCKESGEYCSRKYMHDLWTSNVLPSYKDLYVGDVCTLNKQNREYFIECMLNIWEKFMSMPQVAAMETKFSDCCIAILRAMSEGFNVIVYIAEGVAKPFQKLTDMTHDQQKTAKKVCVQIINAHKRLYLAPPATARALQHAINKSKRTRPEVLATKGNFIAGKMLPTRRTHMTQNKLRSNAQMTSIIPQDMKLHSIIGIIVDNVASLEELRSYSMSEFNK